MKKYYTKDCKQRGVAQSGSVHAWGAWGRRFKSSRPDHKLALVCKSLLLFCFAYCSLVKAGQCEKIVMAGDLNWQPYVVTHGGKVSGLAVELAEKIFADLDVPVVFSGYTKLDRILDDVRSGKIDFIVSSYDNRSLNKIVDFIRPGFMLDPIVIAVSRSNMTNLSACSLDNWEGLIGKKGYLADNFVAADKFERYISKFLNLKPKRNIVQAMYLLENGNGDYILGSKLHLAYLIKQHKLQNKLSILPNLQNESYVSMGFAKNSACNIYRAYLKTKLQGYKQDGTIDRLVQKY